VSSAEEAVRLTDLASDSDLPGGLDDTRVCYWRSPGGWWIYLPSAGVGRLVNHEVTEHEDGTITVKPSIGLGRAGAPGGFARHGFLTRGEWREC
jgi:hypothetical protein